MAVDVEVLGVRVEMDTEEREARRNIDGGGRKGYGTRDLAQDGRITEVEEEESEGEVKEKGGKGRGT